MFSAQSYVLIKAIPFNSHKNGKAYIQTKSSFDWNIKKLRKHASLCTVTINIIQTS